MILASVRRGQKRRSTSKLYFVIHIFLAVGCEKQDFDKSVSAPCYRASASVKWDEITKEIVVAVVGDLMETQSRKNKERGVWNLKAMWKEMGLIRRATSGRGGGPRGVGQDAGWPLGVSRMKGHSNSFHRDGGYFLYGREGIYIRSFRLRPFD